MIASRLLRTALLVICLGVVLFGSVSSASGQVLDDVIRYSQRFPAPSGPVMGTAGAGLMAGREELGTLVGNPAGLGWMSTSMVGGDFAAQRARNNSRFLTPDDNATAERTASDYRLGRLGGAYVFPTEQGSAVIGVAYHQINTYERGFDVAGTNASNSITPTFLPSSAGFSAEEVEEDGVYNLAFDRVRSRIAYDAGAIRFSSSDFEGGNFPFAEAATPGGGQTIQQQDDVFESGQMNEINIGGAVEVAPGVMVGGGLNIAFGSYRFERFYRETDLRSVNSRSQLNDTYSPDGTDLEGFKELRFERRIDTDLSGANFRMGVSAELTDGLRSGLLIESPTWYSVTEVFGARIETAFDCNGQGCDPNGVPGLSSGSLTGNEFEYRLQTPWRIGAGLQYTQSGLMIAADVEFVDWTQTSVTADNESFSELNREIRALDATVNASAGIEYAFDQVAVRGGAAYRPDARGESFSDVNGESTDRNRLFFSAGVSYTPTETFALHLNWLQERVDDQSASYDGGPSIREQLQRNRFVLGMTFRF